MISIVKALLWERWKRTGWAVITACVLPILGCLLILSGRMSPFYVSEATIKIFWFIGYIILILALLMSYCESHEIDISFPKRLFRLPVSTMTLFFVYTCYGISVIALQYIVLFRFPYIFHFSSSYTWPHLLWLETVYITVQTLAWISWMLESRIRLFFLSFTLLFLFVSSVFVFLNMDNFFTVNTVLCPIIILSCIVISFLSISTHRHSGQVNEYGWLDSFLEIFSRNRKKPFASPLKAQVWYEMRQTGYLFPITALCIIGLLLGWWVLFFNPPVLFIDFVPALFILMLAAAFISSLIAFLIYRKDQSSGASSFWLRHPISTKALAMARLRAMLKSLFRVLAVLAVLILVVATYKWLINDMLPAIRFTPVPIALDGSPLIKIVTMTILGILGFIFFYWILLRLSPLIIGFICLGITISIPLKMFLGFIMSITGLTYSAQAGGPSVFNTEEVIFRLFFSTFTIHFVDCVLYRKRRGLISNTVVILSACTFPIAVTSLAPFYFRIGLAFHPFIIISVATLPFLPVALTPLIMDKMRHR